MKLLLDTNALLWALSDSPRIRPVAQRLLDADNEVFFSVASLWEITIKHGIGKLPTPADEVRRVAREDGFVELPIQGPHVLAVAHLPLVHRDPFDRLLVAQARSEPMLLLTGDRQLASYGDLVEVF